VQFEEDDQIEAVLPVASTPGLHHAFTGNKFDVASRNMSAE
jgi:hypothetical protein